MGYYVSILLWFQVMAIALVIGMDTLNMLMLMACMYLQ